MNFTQQDLANSTIQEINSMLNSIKKDALNSNDCEYNLKIMEDNANTLLKTFALLEKIIMDPNNKNIKSDMETIYKSLKESAETMKRYLGDLFLELSKNNNHKFLQRWININNIITALLTSINTR